MTDPNAYTCPDCKKDDIKSFQGLSAHRTRCKVRINNAKLILQQRKRKYEGHGYERGASVSTEFSVARTGRSIIATGRQRQVRGVRYSSTSLWVKQSTNTLASKKIAAMKAAEALDESDYDESDEEEDGLHVDFNPCPASDNESDDNEEEEEEELAWEEVQRSMDNAHEEFPGRQEAIKNTREKLKTKWKDYVEGDGVVQNEDGTFDSSFASPFVYRNNLPPYIIAQVSLMKILSQSRSKTLTLFDRIIEWVHWFADKYPEVWTDREMQVHRTRKSTLSFLKKFFGLKHAMPEPKEVTLSDGVTKVTVPVFPFAESLKSLLTNPDVINDDNLIREHFDKDTWRPTKKYSEMDPDDRVDDLNTGYLLEKGIELYANGPKPPDVDIILPCGVCMFTDESHHDTNGGNKSGPVSMTVHPLHSDARAKYENWENIGFLPNLHVGKGNNSDNYDDDWVEIHNKKRGKKTKTAAATRKMAVEDQQILYGAVLESFIEFCKKTGGLRIMYKGMRALVKPFLLSCVGDTKEYNMMANHYNASGSKLIRCLSKDCMCSFLQIGTRVPPVCTPITLADLEHAMEDPDYAKRISQHQVRSRWNDLPMANDVEGINGSTPMEPVHVHGQGSYKDGAKRIHDFFGSGKTKKAEKETLDLLFKAVSKDMSRCSERWFPIFSSRFGPMDLTRLTANETKGNYFVIMICLHTTRGHHLLKDLVKENHGLRLADVVYTMSLLLAYDEWTKGRDLRRWEVDHAEDAVAHLMQCMIDFLPIELVEKEKGSNVPGCNGYHKVKFHALWLILMYVRKLGSVRGFTGEHGERFHITAVKANGDLTQRRNSSFSYQVACRDGESNVINMAYRYISDLCPPCNHHEYKPKGAIPEVAEVSDNVGFHDGLTKSPHPTVTPKGRYDLTCPPASGRMNEIGYKHTWKQKAKIVLGIKLNEHMLHVLSKWAMRQGYKQTYYCTGFTEIRVHAKSGDVIYRATESFYGSDWYDWALIRDPKYRETTYIAKILGFVRFTTPGFPTPYLVDKLKLAPEHLEVDRARDDKLYAVVRASTECYTEEQLASKMITQFKLTDDDSGFIVPVSHLMMPLLVVRDIGGANSLGYLHCLPQNKWSGLFTSLIKQLKEE